MYFEPKGLPVVGVTYMEETKRSSRTLLRFGALLAPGAQEQTRDPSAI